MELLKALEDCIISGTESIGEDGFIWKKVWSWLQSAQEATGIECVDRNSGRHQTMMETTWRGQLKGKNFHHWEKKQIHFNAALSIVMSPKTLVGVKRRVPAQVALEVAGTCSALSHFRADDVRSFPKRNPTSHFFFWKDASPSSRRQQP
jgi:hypothetical protein